MDPKTWDNNDLNRHWESTRTSEWGRDGLIVITVITKTEVPIYYSSCEEYVVKLEEELIKYCQTTKNDKRVQLNSAIVHKCEGRPQGLALYVTIRLSNYSIDTWGGGDEACLVANQQPYFLESNSSKVVMDVMSQDNQSTSPQLTQLADKEERKRESPSFVMEEENRQSRAQLLELRDMEASTASDQKERERLSNKKEKESADATQRIDELEQKYQNQIQANKNLLEENERLMKSLDEKSQTAVDLEKEVDSLRQQLQRTREESVSMEQSNKVLIEKVSRYDITLSEKELGRGGWGVIWIGRMRVAVKQIHQSIKSDTSLELLRQEINTMSQIRHPNLVRLIGAVFDEDSPDMIITEVMDTSLRKAYERKELTPDPSCRPVILSIMRDVAVGLSYLHCLPKPIIHRDVSSSNVLLQSIGPGRWRAKISDFGSAKSAQLAVTKVPGALAYSAPETFQSITNQDAITKQTPKMDVFSYGVLLCEAITCRFPDRDAFQDMLHQVYCINDRPRGSRSTQGYLLHALILSSCNDDPSKRPTMNEAMKQLDIIAM